MIVIHAIWSEGELHVWGELPQSPAPSSDENAPRSVDATKNGAGVAITRSELRRRIGDIWDSLLASGARDSSITLRLPHRDGQFVSSIGARTPPNEPAGETGNTSALMLAPVTVETLVFEAADAIDLLTAKPVHDAQVIGVGASLCYWAQVARFVLELLAKQRFVPAVHRIGTDRYRGYWRVVVSGQDASTELGAIIASMPPVCRSRIASEVASEAAPQASHLVENFLWATVDALVRRSLDGDELAHTLHDEPDDSWSPVMRWLRSLVCRDSLIQADPNAGARIHRIVDQWLARVASPILEQAYRICFRLHAPSRRESVPSIDTTPTWRLTTHLQATHGTGLILDASKLWDDPSDEPQILERPFQGAREHLRPEIARAANRFEPLAGGAESGGPLTWNLSVDQAYSFLRDAAPLLDRDGFGVWLPDWWNDSRPRLRARLEIRPLESQGAGTAAPADLSLDALVECNWQVALGDEALSMEALGALAESKAPLVRMRGRWTEVNAAEIRSALRFLQKRQVKKMTVFEALRTYYAADDLDTGLPVAGLRAVGWVAHLLHATDASESKDKLVPPAAFCGTLRPYQLAGLGWMRFLARHRLGACLADDMGLGKTIQLIALWLDERENKPSPGPTLLVVPMSLVGNWQREIARFAPPLRVMVHHGMERLTGEAFVEEVARNDVVISTYGLTHRDFEHLAAIDWYRVALDEAQNIKNPVAKQSAAVRALRATHRMALTGTPVENRLSELWSIMDFLNPGYLGTASDFRKRLAVPIERMHDPDRTERLRHLIRPFVLRRLKSDPTIVPDLPDKLEMKVFCNLASEQAGLYQAIVDEMLGRIDLAGGIQRRGLVLAALVKLKQICNHPALFLGDGSSLPHRSGKCDRLCEMLEEVLAEGDRALVFTQFRQMGHLLQRSLKETLGCDSIFLHGGTTQKKRDAMVQKFQNEEKDARVFILSLKAGGFGLNLTAANHVFHFDRWWNPAVEDQATDRAHRIGQNRQVQVHKFVCIGTLEERIDELIEKKRSLADNIIGGGEDWVTELSTEALRDMFALSGEAVSED